MNPLKPTHSEKLNLDGFFSKFVPQSFRRQEGSESTDETKKFETDKLKFFVGAENFKLSVRQNEFLQNASKHFSDEVTEDSNIYLKDFGDFNGFSTNRD